MFNVAQCDYSCHESKLIVIDVHSFFKTPWSKKWLTFSILLHYLMSLDVLYCYAMLCQITMKIVLYILYQNAISGKRQKFVIGLSSIKLSSNNGHLFPLSIFHHVKLNSLWSSTKEWRLSSTACSILPLPLVNAQLKSPLTSSLAQTSRFIW